MAYLFGAPSQTTSVSTTTTLPIQTKSANHTKKAFRWSAKMEKRELRPLRSTSTTRARTSVTKKVSASPGLEHVEHVEDVAPRKTAIRFESDVLKERAAAEARERKLLVENKIQMTDFAYVNGKDLEEGQKLREKRHGAHEMKERIENRYEDTLGRVWA